MHLKTSQGTVSLLLPRVFGKGKRNKEQATAAGKRVHNTRFIPLIKLFSIVDVDRQVQVIFVDILACIQNMKEKRPRKNKEKVHDTQDLQS